MKRSLVLALFLFLANLARADDTTKLATLSGTVVKEPGSQPLKKVLLHLVAEDQQQGGNYTADTDSEGRFLFEKVEPGRYRLLLEKSGFHAVNLRGHPSEGSILSVRAGQEINDLLFQMLQSAVIAGRVVDEDGDPLPGYGVSLLKKRPGKSREPEIAGDERTNDRGEYRFSGLFPGQYMIAVVPPPDIRNFAHANKDSPDTARKPDLAYLTTYYPGTSDSAQASAIDLHAGDELPINFSLVPSRSYRIRGIVTGIPANQKPMVQLISRGVNQTMNGADIAADGQFEIRGVAPGSYLIEAFAGMEAQSLTAREPVSVVAADVEGLKLTPVRPFTVSGLLRFDAPSRKDITQCSVYLRALDDNDLTSGVSASSMTQVDRFGNFQWTGVNPGTYVAHFSAEGNPDLFLKYVRVGASNMDAGFSLTGPASVELVLSPKGGMLEGVVLDNDKPASNATVVAVPEEKYRKIHERFGVVSTDQNGHFTIRGLAPGSYTVFAWQDLDDGLYYDAGFLKSQESNSAPLKVEEGSRQKMELKLSTMGEEWQ
jgi:protocatechuate 3,4-dioxygenase beta subunit